MLFVLYTLVWLLLSGIFGAITKVDFTTLGHSVGSKIMIGLFVIGLIGIVIFYIYNYYRLSDREDEEKLQITSIALLVVYFIIVMLTVTITGNKSEQLCKKMICVVAILLPLTTLAITIIRGRIKKFSYLDCLLDYFGLEAHMFKYVAIVIGEMMVGALIIAGLMAVGIDSDMGKYDFRDD